jgi:hypothetical protein
MDLKTILGQLSMRSDLSMKLQIGGFRHYKDYGFESQGRHPYLRSFSIQKHIAVAMGWPIASIKPGQIDSHHRGPVRYPLEDLRRSFQESNVLHLYHKVDHDKDNDFFLVLGRVDRFVGDELHIQKAEEVLRMYMAGIQPFELTINPENLFIVGFLDSQLPITTSRPFTIKEVEQPAIQDKILTLYGEPQ